MQTNRLDMRRDDNRRRWGPDEMVIDITGVSSSFMYASLHFMDNTFACQQDKSEKRNGLLEGQPPTHFHHITGFFMDVWRVQWRYQNDLRTSKRPFLLGTLF